jgi:hypothetical protein
MSAARARFAMTSFAVAFSSSIFESPLIYPKIASDSSKHKTQLPTAPHPTIDSFDDITHLIPKQQITKIDLK